MIHVVYILLYIGMYFEVFSVTNNFWLTIGVTFFGMVMNVLGYGEGRFKGLK